MWHAYADKVICAGEETDPLPLWLDEGMAEFFKNSQFDLANTFSSGSDIDHIDTLKLAGRKQWIPLEKLFSIDAGRSRDKNPKLFYAESWLLVFYLNQKFDFQKDKVLLSYIEDLRKSGDPVASFEKVFDMKLIDVEEKLKNSIFAGMR
jgi:hypothetical protein